jgi:hypothetical protein
MKGFSGGAVKACVFTKDTSSICNVQYIHKSNKRSNSISQAIKKLHVCGVGIQDRRSAVDMQLVE